MSHHYVTHLMSHHYITHLMSHHYFTGTTLLPIYSGVAAFYFNPSSLPTSNRIILLVTSAHPLRSNFCPPRSVHLSRRIGIGSQGVSCKCLSLDLMWLISCLDLMSLITKSLISCLITTSLISCLIITSLISCLIITSLILRYCLYTLGWPHFTSTHDLCPLVTA